MSEQEIIPAPVRARVGRPSDYMESFCEDVVDFCVGGKSLTGFAASIGVARSTISVWMDKYPEFKEACGRAKAQSAAFWEGQGVKVATGAVPGSAAQMIKFGMINMGGEDWQETTKIDHTSSDRSMSPAGLSALYGDDESDEKVPS
jgi:hypothetical protein